MLSAEKTKSSKSGRAANLRMMPPEPNDAFTGVRDEPLRFTDTVDQLLSKQPAQSFPRSTHERMGKLLGNAIASEQDLVKMVNKGLPASALRRMSETMDLDLSLVGPETTMRRRLQEKQKLTTDESERLVRIARITALAQALFEDPIAANRWLSTPASFLTDSESISPLQLATTDSGARVVESLMLQTAHGIF
jgi:putative toxin-antitoxin system antitoxin component (TIGR02293 family)